MLLHRFPLICQMKKKIPFMSDEPNSSDAKKKAALMFSLLLHASELLQPFLCFSFFFDEYLTLAQRVALILGSLPLALRAMLGLSRTP